ncbi:MAG: CinA family protein [Candidatus Kappaea frigidicola]|nr:CinA family protein [Candidatus Kappaea frigidicola]
MRNKINEINKKVAILLKVNNVNLAAAESCTGGLFSDYITNISGASTYFKGCIVAYSNQSKVDMLKVPKKLLKNYGAVSAQVALAMASGAREVFSSDIAISVTGIAGPQGGTKNKPVGLVYICLVNQDNIKVTKKIILKGSRNSIKLKAVYTMLCMLYDYLK